jgi:hypothetical protein
MIPKKVAAEVAEWPGAKIVGVEIGRKHHRLRLTYGGKERFMMLSGSPSDRCAENNQIRDVRKVLTELGASRSQRRKATMKRQRNKPDRTMPSATFAPVKADPWAVLHSLTFEPAPRDRIVAADFLIILTPSMTFTLGARMVVGSGPGSSAPQATAAIASQTRTGSRLNEPTAQSRTASLFVTPATTGAA